MESLWAEDSSAVLEESQKITPIQAATSIQHMAVLIFSCRIYKIDPSASGVKLHAADSLCLYII